MVGVMPECAQDPYNAIIGTKLCVPIPEEDSRVETAAYFRDLSFQP